jgi:SPP1 gp7 family putative phage head morphogenesis protein
MPVDYAATPFQEMLNFFLGKDLIPTERWADLWRDAHDSGFMVAGAQAADLLQGFHDAITRAIEQGTTLAEFRKDFDALVERHGWSYKGSRGWRTRLIFETNLRTAYQAGRWAQIQAGKDRRPYLLYKHSDAVTTPRPLHVSWDGLILPVDDPWWRTHYPPNGWGCKCRVFALREADLARYGKTAPDTAPDDGTYDWTDKKTGELHRGIPNGIDPGWDYAPGATRTERAQEQVERKQIDLDPELRGLLQDFVDSRPAAVAP